MIDIRPGFTALVGPNNSGKTSLLRFFYEFRQLFGLVGSTDSLLSMIRGPFARQLQTLREPTEVFHRLNDRGLAIEASQTGTNLESARSLRINVSRKEVTFAVESLRTENFDFAGNNKAAVQQIGANRLQLPTMNAGCDLSNLQEPFVDLWNSMYVGSFRNAINLGELGTYFDIQSGQAFIAAWQNFKTGPSAKNNDAAGLVEEDVARIFGFSKFDASATADNHDLVVRIDGKSFALSEVGSGVAHFLITLANVAMREPAYVLIDEPELGLHPSLQVEFLTILSRYARKGVIFSTHSFGLARSISDRIYSFQKTTTFTSRMSLLQTTTRLSEFLGEMSYSAYRELGFDSILLVEGPTDVPAVRELLRLYSKDREFVVIPLGGNGLINGNQDTTWQLEELKRISSKVFALIDRDPDPGCQEIPKARQDFATICASAKVDCLVMERRALENYWTTPALKGFRPTLTALEPFDRLNDKWSKRDNWQIAQNMTREELEHTDIGKFLSRL